MTIAHGKLAQRAEILARVTHWGQTDKLGIDYIAHLEHVARSVEAHGETAVAVAWLHDVVEDCENIDLDDIEVLFTHEIRDAVDALTRREGEGYFESYLPRLMRNPIAATVKFADSRHNRGRAHLIANTENSRSLRKRYDRVLSEIGKAYPTTVIPGPVPKLRFDGEHWIEDTA